MGGGSVDLTLSGASILASGNYRAGLEVAATASLSVSAASTGSLSATGGAGGAGIGGGNGVDSGSIAVRGGAVTATGGDAGAGIGGGTSAGGSEGNGRDVSVEGGTVTATGGEWAAGIGGGNGGDGERISVSGGTVVATGGEWAAGIGGGNVGDGRDVSVSGGLVTAVGGGEDGAGAGAGIGGGGFSVSVGDTPTVAEDVTVSGGTVRAEGGSFVGGTAAYSAPGVGGGVDYDFGQVKYGAAARIFVDPAAGRRIEAYNAASADPGKELSDSPYSVRTDIARHLNGPAYSRDFFSAEVLPVSFSLSGLAVGSGGPEARYGQAYAATLVPEQGYALPRGVSVSVGGAPLTSGYTWDADTGALEIEAASVTGALEIEATGLKTRTISLPGTADVGRESVTLQPAVPSAGADDGDVQYAVSATNAAPANDSDWQPGTAFGRLAPGTAYWFFARVTGGTVHADAVSEGLPATTLPPVYAVTVNGGTSSLDEAEAGKEVTIEAQVPNGMGFAGWTMSPDVTFTSGDKSTPKATFTMPADAVTATASFEDLPSPVTVIGGTSSVPEAKEGEEVTIEAQVPNGMRFAGWAISPAVTFTSGGVDDPKATFTMPAGPVTATASFEDLPSAVSVVGGTSNVPEAKEGEPVTIEAQVPSGMRFAGWTMSPDVVFTSGSKDDPKATFTMPAGPVTATASFEDLPSPVTVVGGTSSVPEAKEGESVTIEADVPNGMRFAGWAVSPDVTFTLGDKSTPKATFTMPAGAVTATASFEDLPSPVTVNGGTSSVPQAKEGESVTIEAQVPNGMRFDGWAISPAVTFTSGGVDDPKATFTMPAGAVTASASFEDLPSPVTVNGGTSNVPEAKEGEEVTIEADIPSGMRFAGWTMSPDVVFASGSKDDPKATFTMPAGPVTAIASFEDLPSAVSVVGGTSSVPEAKEGELVTIEAQVPNGMRFAGWAVSPDVTFTSGGKDAPRATFTMPAGAVTATASFEALPPSHVHAYGGWKHDAVGHWRECGCGDIVDKGAHEWGAWKAAEGGGRSRTCAVCGYVQTEAAAVLPRSGDGPAAPIALAALASASALLVLARGRRAR